MLNTLERLRTLFALDNGVTVDRIVAALAGDDGALAELIGADERTHGLASGYLEVVRAAREERRNGPVEPPAAETEIQPRRINP